MSVFVHLGRVVKVILYRILWWCCCPKVPQTWSKFVVNSTKRILETISRGLHTNFVLAARTVTVLFCSSRWGWSLLWIKVFFSGRASAVFSRPIWACVRLHPLLCGRKEVAFAQSVAFFGVG